MKKLDLEQMIADGKKAELERALSAIDPKFGNARGEIARLMMWHADNECAPLHAIIRGLRAAFSPVEQAPPAQGEDEL